MATDTATSNPSESAAANEAQPDASPQKSSGSRSILVIAGIIVFVMVAEAAVFYFLGIGSNDASPQEAGEQAAQAEKDEEGTPQDDFKEVDIDTFNVTNTRAAADAIVHVSFKLVAVVAKGAEVEFDEAANKNHKARVRQVVVEVARSATLEDLNDPTLNTFKRLIQEKINKVLRRSFVTEAVISEFKAIEQ